MKLKIIPFRFFLSLDNKRSSKSKPLSTNKVSHNRLILYVQTLRSAYIVRVQNGLMCCKGALERSKYYVLIHICCNNTILYIVLLAGTESLV